MTDSFIGEHNEAVSQISEVYSSRGRSYLNIIIENGDYNCKPCFTLCIALYIVHYTCALQV